METRRPRALEAGNSYRAEEILRYYLRIMKMVRWEEKSLNNLFESCLALMQLSPETPVHVVLKGGKKKLIFWPESAPSLRLSRRIADSILHAGQVNQTKH